ncbi:type VI secretion system Vgr family protein [Aquabacterium sp.]|uniref:type VI secretion system Vgr family protein n=1 Tax=Aquabacterium sp. TaxID=1872578 RepID=UPI00378442CC
MPTSPISLSSPLPAADLRFESLSFSSGLSLLEEMQLHLTSDKPDLKPEDLLGLPMAVTITLRDGAQRHVCGYVAQFGLGRHQGRYFGYQAKVVPWLWFLTRRADCRIFQDMTVPDIVKEVFKNHAAIANCEFKLVRSYRKRTYCVQYRETDFNFVARLMEDEGIYWYFAHAPGEHKLMIVDSSSAHAAAPGNAKIPYYANIGQTSPDVDFISDWNFSREVKPGKIALTSYDFERPSTSLKVETANPQGHELSKYEQFDFQGDYLQKSDGQQLADNRIDELHARFEQLSGRTNAHGLATGTLFELAEHPRADQNAEYLCVQAHVSARIHGHESGNEAGEYQCSFLAIPSGQQYRPPRRTPKPFVQGPQTAVVVGPGGEEIFTDKYSRVKVQFHWDRYGKKNESSSCWMRVASVWAGKSFGFIQVPRIGQEVIVDFLEGDPDQPLITGRVYNAEQMPPWDLPANATQSGVLSRSSKGGAYGNANALRFEDKKGSEQVWLHAEKNQDIEVENDETHWVGHDRDKTIDHDETNHIKHDRTETVDHDETITIHHDRTETVDNNESITIGVNRTESVGRNESITIGNNRAESVGANESVSIGKNRTMDVADNESLSVGKNREHTVGKDETISVGQHLKHSVAKNATVEIGEKRETKVGKDDLVQVGKKFYLEAGDEITLKTGDASITLKKDGTIQIKGKDITISGNGKIGIKASSDVTIKGSKIAEN